MNENSIVSNTKMNKKNILKYVDEYFARELNEINSLESSIDANADNSSHLTYKPVSKYKIIKKKYFERKIFFVVILIVFVNFIIGLF